MLEADILLGRLFFELIGGVVFFEFGGDLFDEIVGEVFLLEIENLPVLTTGSWYCTTTGGNRSLVFAVIAVGE